MAFRNDDDKKAYWKENLSLLAKLLVVWFAVSFGAGIVFVDVLDNIHFFGFKLGFWFAQQGSIYVFVALIFVYMSKMKAMDKRYGVNEE
jgi:putative solute:sodium symporter small subunit